MVNICRLCLGDVPDAPISVYNDAASHEIKIKFVIPEIDLSITPNFDLCYLCTHLLCAAYSFMRGCIQTENVVKEYISQNGTTMLSLENVKQYRKYKVSKIGNNLVENDNIKIEIHDEDIKINSDTNTLGIQKSSFNCNRCGIIFNNEDSIEAHQKECNLYQCNECNEVCLTEDELENHLKLHTMKKPHICEICKQPFNEHSELKHHMFTQHNTKSVTRTASFQSLVCKSLKNKYSNDISNRNCHSHPLHKIDNRYKSQEYKCKVCNKAFKLRWIFRKHLLHHHPKPFVCDICGQRCTEKCNLIEHMRVHTGERPFKCETCGKAFAQRGTLTVHIKCVHENIKHFVCEVCGRGFTIHSMLARHMRVHRDPVEKTFCCLHEGCDKMFNTQEAVARHMQRHTAIKRHKCTVCDKAFIDATALKIHMRTHTGERPYACHICEKAFSTAYNLKVHFKSHRPK